MFSKLYSSMYDGSLATRGPWQALVTFQQMLILCDRFGTVDMTLEAIHRRTTVPLDVLETGIKELLKPDPDSRRPDEDGRRIIPIDPSRDWGWTVVNYAHYRQIRSAEERNAYQRDYMRDYRAGKRRKPTGDAKPKAKGNGADTHGALPKPRNGVDLEPLPDWIPLDLWASWWKIRPAKARTQHAQDLAIKELVKYRNAGHTPQSILESCIRNGWRGIFPPSGKPPHKPKRNDIPAI